MATVRLTDRKLRVLSADQTQEDFFCDRLEGFGVRVSGETGRRSFFVRYRQNGRRRRVTLGRHPDLSLADARDLAKGVLGAVATGGDPAAEAKADRAGDSFGELADLYLERHARANKAPKSVREDERQIEKDLRPAWGRRKAADITRSDVLHLLDRIVDRGAPVMANRTLALVSRIYTFGVERGVVEVNPAYRVKPPTRERSRQRVMTNVEIKRFWNALDRLTPLMGATFRLRLLTAQRGIEVLSMRQEAIDGSWWTIPAQVSKTGESHRVPLSPSAMGILREIEPLARGGFVFPSQRGGHIAFISKAAARLRERAKLEDWHPHDLRRTAATKMTGELGISRFVVGRILNHADGGITHVYDRSAYEAEKRDALDAWDKLVEEILS